MNYKFRLLLPSFVKDLLRPFAYLSIFADSRSVVEYWKIVHCKEGKYGSHSGTVDLKIRKLGGRSVTIRIKGSTYL